MDIAATLPLPPPSAAVEMETTVPAPAAAPMLMNGHAVASKAPEAAPHQQLKAHSKTSSSHESNGSEQHVPVDVAVAVAPVTVATTPAAATCEMKRILVAGGAGFIGIHLCTRLLEQGHEVICLDNLFTSQKMSVQQLQRKYANFEFVRHDITLPYYCEVDEIYNLACPASPVHYQYNAIKTTKVSFLGSLNLLGLAKRVKGRIFQASTSEVYGDPEVSPQREDYLGHVNCTGVRACYDEGKRVAETLFFEYHRTHNVDIRVARIFNTYGPGMHPYDGRVVSNFIMQALADEDITIYGAGCQTRSFCYVDDLVDAIVRFMDCTSTVGPLNMGNPHEMTILQLAQMVIRLTGSKSRLVHHSLPNNDPKLRRPDISLAKAHLDWTPHVGIEEGLMRTIEYFRALDLSKYKRPTNHTAHRSSDLANQTATQSH